LCEGEREAGREAGRGREREREEVKAHVARGRVAQENEPFVT